MEALEDGETVSVQNVGIDEGIELDFEIVFFLRDTVNQKDNIPKDNQ